MNLQNRKVLKKKAAAKKKQTRWQVKPLRLRKSLNMQKQKLAGKKNLQWRRLNNKMNLSQDFWASSFYLIRFLLDTEFTPP
jgi:hypothetical protein